MLWLFTYNTVRAVTSDDFALAADLFDTCTYFHTDHAPFLCVHDTLLKINNLPRRDLYRVAQLGMSGKHRSAAYFWYVSIGAQRLAQDVLLCKGPSLGFAIGDSALSKIVRGQLDRNAVAWHNSDKVFPHFACNVSYDFMAVLEFNTKLSTR